MNDKNFEYLKMQLNRTFGEGLENDLQEKIQQQAPDFQLFHEKKFGNDTTVATLNFHKSDQDMYFFNNYHVNLKQEGSQDDIEQTFYVNKKSTFTIDEAYDLLRGLSVNKDVERLEKVGEGEDVRFVATGETYNTYVKLNFSQKDKNGNYKQQHSKDNNFDLDAGSAKGQNAEMQTQEQSQNKTMGIGNSTDKALSKGKSTATGKVRNTSSKKDNKDTSVLNPDQVMKFFDGEDWIVKNREKTWCRENVPLLPIAKEIKGIYYRWVQYDDHYGNCCRLMFWLWGREQ